MPQIQNKTKLLAHMALFVALEIILSRFFSINTELVRIGFGWLPIVIIATLYGPIIAGATWAIADVVGFFLFGAGLGPYFPGFTLTNFIGGVVLGLFLYQRPVTVVKIVLTVLLLSILSLGLNSVWLSILFGRGFWIVFISRILQTAILAPLQLILIWVVAAEKSPTSETLRRLAV